MSKVIKIVLIVFALIFLIGGGILVYLAYQEQKGSGGLGDLFPIGGNNTEPTPNGNDDVIIDDGSFPDNSGGIRKFFQITINPIAGFTTFETSEGTFVRYMEKGTGNIFDYNTRTDSQTQISNKTIEFVQEVYWGENGNEFITRSLLPDGDIKNIYYSFDKPSAEIFFFEKNLKQGDNNEDVKNMQKALNKNPETLIAITGTGSPGNESPLYGKKTADAVKKFQEKYRSEIGTSTAGVFDDATRKKMNDLFKPQPSSIQSTELFEKELSRKIIGIAVSPNKKEIFYLELFGDQGVSGNRAKLDGAGKKELLTSDIKEWNIEWSSPLKIFLTTKSSQNVPGSAYELDLKTNQLRKLFSGIPGLTAKENIDGSLVVYSKKSEQGNGFSTHIYSVLDGNHTVTNISTLPDKCVWDESDKEILYCGIPSSIPVGKYPDDWYKGRVSLFDNVVSFTFDTLSQNLLVNPSLETLTTKIDIAEIKHKKEGFLFFQNKEDSSLWGIRMGEVSGASSN